jgi:NAD(P)-dependent dehydrogenase (short-subunit alcohol dehydrogenase family)
MKIMIAGASGGIGAFLTKEFDSADNELILTYNKSKDKMYVLQQAKATVLQCDFTRRDNVKRAFSELNDIDVLINVMGHFENKMISQMDEGEWDRVIDSNLKTVFLSCSNAVGKMTQGGHIINISSILGTTGMIGATNYAAAKGLECLHKNRVFVNAIALGYFKIGMGLNLSEKIAAMVRDKIPIKEFGEPEEIAKLVRYMISSQYLAGQVIHLNGGLRI